MLLHRKIIYAAAALMSLTVGLPGGAYANDHPSLFFQTSDLPEIRQRAKALPWLEQTQKHILAVADEYLETPTQPYPLTGPKNASGTAGRALQNRLGTLGFAGLLTGEARYSEKGKDMLLAVVRQTQPNNKSHWRGHLQQADATQAIVLGYDWLYPFMSPPERQEVRAEILEFGQALWDGDTAWGSPAPGILSCNHNSVQFGALGLAALALGDRPEWLEFSIERTRGYFAGFADETGYATEGHHYLGYGLGGAVPFSMALKQSGGPDLLAEAKTLPYTGDQALWKLLPFEGRMLALNDNDERPAEVPGLVGPLRAGNGTQLWAVLESLKEADHEHELGGYFGISYVSPFLFLWGDEPTMPVHPKDAGTPLGHHFESGRVFLRSGWESERDAHVSMTSGYDFHRGHDHQDENSVTFFANGEGFLIDPQYWLETSDAHTTLTIEGMEQIKGGDGRIVEYREDRRGAMVRGQAEEAYDFTAQFLGHADRKLYFVRAPRPYIVIRDDMRIENDKPAPFISRYITYPDNKITPYGDSVIVTGGRLGEKALFAAFSGTQAVKLQEDDIQDVVLERRGKEFSYAKYMRRISANFTDISPELMTFVIPFQGDDKPKITITKGDKRGAFRAQVKFSDGTIDHFDITGTNITIKE